MLCCWLKLHHVHCCGNCEPSLCALLRDRLGPPHWSCKIHSFHPSRTCPGSSIKSLICVHLEGLNFKQEQFVLALAMLHRGSRSPRLDTKSSFHARCWPFNSSPSCHVTQSLSTSLAQGVPTQTSQHNVHNSRAVLRRPSSWPWPLDWYWILDRFELRVSRWRKRGHGESQYFPSISSPFVGSPSLPESHSRRPWCGVNRLTTVEPASAQQCRSLVLRCFEGYNLVLTEMLYWCVLICYQTLCTHSAKVLWQVFLDDTLEMESFVCLYVICKYAPVSELNVQTMKAWQPLWLRTKPHVDASVRDACVHHHGRGCFIRFCVHHPQWAMQD